MAKRMGFSVIGLPHYTIWHLYEPSVDDLRHMEEMEQERKAREREEKEQAERAERMKALFVEPGPQWDIDKAFVQDSIQTEKQEAGQTKADGVTGAAEVKDVQGSASHPAAASPKPSVNAAPVVQGRPGEAERSV
jgi:mannan polymerase II complex ANP1 subunit